MKKTTIPSGKQAKLKLGKNAIVNLNAESSKEIKGGLPRRSVAARQCCETDGFYGCVSIPGICW
jgi:hypothetical protein